MKLIIPENYKPILNVKETEHAIVMIKNFFQLALSTELNLTRVTAPIFVEKGQGLNDDLSGVERPVTFPVLDMQDKQMEIVHSLAKWKRVKLTEMNLNRGFGIYTDMNAIRADEELDNTHSLYVDQWDWEMVIDEEDRTLQTLKSVVTKIYRALKRTEFYIFDHYPMLKPALPEDITFITSEELLKMYPELDSKERENKITEIYGAVFLIGIGKDLSNGKPHDMRSPDYDDWISELNGDILIWNPVLKKAFEISSMGIRVSPKTLHEQLKLRNKLEREKLYFHKMLLSGSLKQSIGGGIGQSRLCMYFLKKAHIGETQVSSWPSEMINNCMNNSIPLL